MPATPSTTARLLLALTLALGALAAPAAADAPPRVRVDLFAEALCPYCAKFLTEQLGGLMDAGFDEVVAFRYVAWGNARNSSQVGPGMSTGALIFRPACAGHSGRLTPPQTLRTPAGRAVPARPRRVPPQPPDQLRRARRGGRPERMAALCSVPRGHARCRHGGRCRRLCERRRAGCQDPPRLRRGRPGRRAGAGGGRGDRSAVPAPQVRRSEGTRCSSEPCDASAATLSALPYLRARRYVPWVLVNDVPLFDSFDKLQLVVCAAYTGERPDACFKPPPGAAGALTLLSAGVGQASTARSAA